MKKRLMVILMAALLSVPLSAMAMDSITSDTLEGVSGQAGVTLALCSPTTTVIDWSELSWGDPGGMGTGCASGLGWLIIDGDVTLRQAVSGGGTLIIDIARTGTAACTQCTNVSVPASTTFLSIDLPTMTTTITVPTSTGFYIGLGTSAGTIAQTLGQLVLTGLTVTQGVPDKIIVYAH